jgi:tape measure domain-containing protein
VAVANIAIEVNGQQAANALKQITTASRQLESAVNNTTTKINNQNSATASASNQLRNYTKTTQVATAATNGLKGAVANLLGAFTAISAAKFIFAKTAELETQTKSLEVLTGSVTKAKAIIQELQQLGAVTPFTSTELIDSAKRLNAFGVEGDKVVETTRRLADVAGATGAELQGLVTAYGQVQAKGRLQGEELLQFQERGVALQEELRKMYGLSGEEFQKALSKGRISAEAVEVAIQRLTDAGGKYANGAIAQSDTLQGKFSTLTDGVEGLARTIGTVLAPQLKGVLNLAIQVVNSINQALAAGSISDQTKQGFKAQAERTVTTQAGRFPGGPFGAGQISIRANGKTYKGDAASVTSSITNDLINKEVARRTSAATKAGSVKTTAGAGGIPELLAETGGGKKKKGKTDAERAAEKAAAEALRLKNSLGNLTVERNLKQQIYGIENKIFEATLKGDKATAIRLEGEKQQARIAAEILKLENEKITPQEKQAKIYAFMQDRVIAQRDTQQELLLNQVQIAKQAEAAIRPIIQEGELLKAKLNGTEQQYQKELLIRQILLGNPTLRRADVEAQVAQNEAAQKQLKTVEDLNAIYNQIGSSITNGVLDGITAAVEGTKSLGESAAQVLKDIAKQLLRSGIIQLISSLAGNDGVGFFSFLSGTLGKRARGGPVSAGKPYMVGERGPELFMPRQGGSIIPNNAFGGGSTNVVVNVDASGSNVQGDQAQAKQLGVAVSAAVQAELVKQQRPGGLLSGTRR